VSFGGNRACLGGINVSGGKRVLGPLTDEQHRLVRENIGLVAVHLRRHISNLAKPRRDREWEDLFQEGCLGLIRAAQAYREDRGIPFAAFALPRIHNAVSRALQNKFSTVHIPPKDGDTHAVAQVAVHRDDKSAQRKVYSLSGEFHDRLADRKRHDPERPDRETIGERLRGKYERAVYMAADAISRKTSRRGDRDKLVRILVEERFMVPHEESRRALRRIARDTRSSYARVAQCDKQLGRAVRGTLEADPEFHELRRRARGTPDGTDILIDDGLERDLAQASAEEFAARFHSADSSEQARMLNALVELSEGGVFDVLRARVSQLPMHGRERLLWKLNTGD